MAFFLTPVIWKAEMLGRNAWAAEYNPYFHFLEVIRQPLLGQSASALSWTAVAVITLSGWLFTLIFFARFRSRVAYWV